MKLKLGLVAVAFALGVTGATADESEIIILRQQLMKTNGQAAKVAVQLIRGEIPFDAAVAAAAAESIAHDVDVFPSLFPAGTETGANTDAGPAIWSDAAGFKAAAEKMVADANAAAAAAAQGKDAFAAAFGTVGQNCQACHQAYRGG